MLSIFITYFVNPVILSMSFEILFPFQVEEIEDVDGNSDDPFVADAIANEKELALSEEQRKFRKVC